MMGIYYESTGADDLDSIDDERIDLSERADVTERPELADEVPDIPEAGEPADLPERADVTERPELADEVPDIPEAGGPADLPERADVTERPEIADEVPGIPETGVPADLPERADFGEHTEIADELSDIPEAGTSSDLSEPLVGAEIVPIKRGGQSVAGEAAKVTETFEETEIATESEGEVVTEADTLAKTKPEQLKFGELEPNTSYERNGHEYQTEEQGRITLVSGKLELGKGIRTSHQTEVGHQGLETDEGGHLIGTRFKGSPEGVNLVPQDANLNRGEWKVMENEWDAALKEGKEVEVIIQPVYTDDGKRPMGFEVLYDIDRQSFTRVFYNESKKA